MPHTDPTKTIEQQQKDFAKVLEKAMKDALKGVDKTAALLEKERKAVAKELDAAREVRKKAEQEGEKIAADYFEQRRTELIEFTRLELLRDLVRMHLEAGRPVNEICHWLNVKKTFVQKIAGLVERLKKYHGPQPDQHHIKLDNNPQLHFFSEGRGGTIRFENNLTSFDMWWEFAGGNALALISIPSEQHWEAVTQLPREQRADILRFIGEQVVASQTSKGGSFIYDDQTMTIYQ